MQTQNFNNHSRIPPRPFMIVLLMSLVVMILSIVMICQGICRSTGCSWPIYFGLILFSLAMIIASFNSRMFALRAQDRAIRAEENLRHFSLTGKLLPATLSVSQIVALRFASDEEFVALVEKALSENLTNKEIKMAIRQWRADEYRV